jgi:predicted  nucleic acid-binding Zn-ribbon protein
MDPAARLLDLQAVDLAIDRLRARQRVLESGSEIGTARATADAAEGDLGELRLRIDALDRDGTKLEHEIDSLSQKAAAEEQRMYDGSVANAKELSSIQHEVENVRRRKASREDELLVLMEEREKVEAAANDAERRSATLRDEVDRIAAESDDELTRVATDLAASDDERASIVAEIDAELLELYEDLRRQKKGVGAAALVDGVCQGCHEQLSSVDLDRVKRSTGVRRCEYCRRILVIR